MITYPTATVWTDLEQQVVLKIKLSTDLLVSAHLKHSQFCPSEVLNTSWLVYGQGGREEKEDL